MAQREDVGYDGDERALFVFLAIAAMPTISAFYGIYIRMYLRDHPPPHFHAMYGEHRAFVAIADGTVIQGHLPAIARRLVREWAVLHMQALAENWDRARAGLPLERIPGLDND